MLICLGIDPGIANCGYAIVKMDKDKKFSVEKSGCIKTSANLPLGKRLIDIKTFINEIIEVYNPNIMGYERMFFNPASNGRNKSASIMHTNMATAMLYMLSSENELDISNYPPTTIKKNVTGNGRAKKEDVISKVKDYFDIDIKTEHEADAIAIGMTTIIKFMEEGGYDKIE